VSEIKTKIIQLLEEKPLLRQIILYGLIGGCGALLDFSLFTVLYKVAGINEFVANIISVHAGIALSFTLNRKYNFKKTDKTAFRAIAFYLTGLFGLALSSGLLWLGNQLDQDTLLVKFISIFIVAAVQFTINKLVAFRK
jgi:putative flippase GtrA